MKTKLRYVNRFIDCATVIDKAIESDMRDTRQYLTGERIDGSFGLVLSYANGAVSMVTGLFFPWVYKKCGYDEAKHTFTRLSEEKRTEEKRLNEQRKQDLENKKQQRKVRQR